MSVCLYVCMSVCLCVCPSVCPSVYLSSPVHSARVVGVCGEVQYLPHTAAGVVANALGTHPPVETGVTLALIYVHVTFLPGVP